MRFLNTTLETEASSRPFLRDPSWLLAPLARPPTHTFPSSPAVCLPRLQDTAARVGAPLREAPALDRFEPEGESLGQVGDSQGLLSRHLDPLPPNWWAHCTVSPPPNLCPQTYVLKSPISCHQPTTRTNPSHPSVHPLRW